MKMGGKTRVVYLDKDKSEIWYVTKESVADSRFRVLLELVEHAGRPVAKQRLANLAHRSEETVRSYIKSFNKSLKAFFGQDRSPIGSQYGEEVWRLEGACELLPSASTGKFVKLKLNGDQIFVLMQIHQYALGYGLTFAFIDFVEAYERVGNFDYERFARAMGAEIKESRHRLSVFDAQSIADFDDYFARVYPPEEFERDLARAASIVTDSALAPFERTAAFRQLLERSHADLTRRHMEVVDAGDGPA